VDPQKKVKRFMSMNNARLACLAVAGAWLVAACSSTNLEQLPMAASETLNASRTSPPAAMPPGPAPGKQVEASPPAPLDRLKGPCSMLSHRGVYLDFDALVVHDLDMPVVQAHGSYFL
jgi:hypothetical protein